MLQQHWESVIRDISRKHLRTPNCMELRTLAENCQLRNTCIMCGSKLSSAGVPALQHCQW